MVETRAERLTSSKDSKQLDFESQLQEDIDTSFCEIQSTQYLLNLTESSYLPHHLATSASDTQQEERHVVATWIDAQSPQFTSLVTDELKEDCLSLLDQDDFFDDETISDSSAKIQDLFRYFGGSSSTQLITADDSQAKSRIHSLPDDVLQLFFSFVGLGHYRYVAGTCRRFRDLYVGLEKRMVPTPRNNKTTCWESAAASVNCATLCIADVPTTKGSRQKHMRLENIFIAAAKLGKVDVLEWALENGLTCRYPLLRPAVQFGQVHVLAWAEDNELWWFTSSSTFREAVRYGQINVLEHMLEHGREIAEGTNATRFAARYGQVCVLSWMQNQNMLTNDKHIWYDAAKHGQLHVLDWLCQQNLSVLENAVGQGAVDGGCKDVLTWMRKHSIGWNEKACMRAAINDNLSLLQWLREHGCPWDRRVFRCAQTRGHKRILEWARKNGCPGEFV